MALYKTDKDGKLIKIAGNLGSDDNKANKDLSNVTYPEIVYDNATNTFDGLTHTGTGDRVIESCVSSDGRTWYRKWASGWKECGGSFDVPNSGSTKDYKMPIAFKTVDSYSVVGTRGWDAAESSNATIGTTCAQQISNQEFRIQTWNGPYKYYACGY